MASGWCLQFTAPPTAHHLPGLALYCAKLPFQLFEAAPGGKIWPQHHRMPTPNLEVKKDIISYIEYNEGIAAILATILCTYLTH
jgi:hypothetical protein